MQVAQENNEALEVLEALEALEALEEKVAALPTHHHAPHVLHAPTRLYFTLHRGVGRPRSPSPGGCCKPGRKRTWPPLGSGQSEHGMQPAI